MTGEEARLRALYAAAVLDTPPEADFDDIAALASDICGTPVGLVNLVDRDRQWTKASTGWSGPAETPRDLSFYTHAVQQGGVFEVDDAASDPRFAGLPAVTDEGVRFYAGAPLILHDRPSPPRAARSPPPRAST